MARRCPWGKFFFENKNLFFSAYNTHECPQKIKAQTVGPAIVNICIMVYTNVLFYSID